MRPQHGQGRKAAMIHRPILKERHVELIRHQPRTDVMSQTSVHLDCAEGSGTPAFSSDGRRLTDSQRKVRIMVKEEGCDVVVVNEEEDIRLLCFEPASHRLVGFKNGGPDRIILFLSVESKPDCWRVRTCNRPDYPCHRYFF